MTTINPYETQLMELEAKQEQTQIEKHSSDIPLSAVFSLPADQLKDLPTFVHATSTVPLRDRNTAIDDRKSHFVASRAALANYLSSNMSTSPSSALASQGSAQRPKQARKPRPSNSKKTAGAKRSRSESMGGDDGSADYDSQEDEADEAVQTKLESESALQQQSSGDLPPLLPSVDLSQMNLEDQPNSHLINPLPPLNFPVHNHSFVASAGFIVERPDKNNITRRYVHYRCAFCGKDTNDKSRHSKHELACSRGAAKSANKPPKKAKTRQPDVRSNTIIYPSRPPMMMDANGMLTGVLHQPLAAPLSQQPALPPSSLVPTLPPVASTLSFEPTLAPEHAPSQQIDQSNGNTPNGTNQVSNQASIV